MTINKHVIRDKAGSFLTDGSLYPDSPAAQRVSVNIYRALALGEAIARNALADRSGIERDALGELLQTFPESTIELDDAGDIIGFVGLSLKPTNHRFEIDGQPLFIWCVFDGLFLPKIIGKAGKIVTNCPQSNQTIEVGVAASKIHYCHPPSTVMSIIAPDVDSCRENLRGAFCSHVNFFKDRNAFRQWSGNSEAMSSLSISEAFKLAKERNISRFRDIRLKARKFFP